MIFEKVHKRVVAEAINENWSKPNDLRFDCDARLEIWVNMSDLEDREDVLAIKHSKELMDNEKIEKLKDIVLKVAHEKVNNISRNAFGDIEVTADISWSTVNINRLNWHQLLHDETEED